MFLYENMSVHMYPIKGFVAKPLPVNFFRLFSDHFFTVVRRSSAAPVSSAAPKKESFDRGGQTGPPRSNDLFFGAADDTGAADDRPTTVKNDPRTTEKSLQAVVLLQIL